MAKYIYLFISISILFNPVFAQNGSIKGQVISATDGPIGFASVNILNKSVGTRTGNNGQYELRNLAPGNYTIVFSSLGYQKQQVPIEVKANGVTTLNASLVKSESRLNDVIVTGVSRATEVRKNPVPVAVMAKKDMDRHVNNNIIDAIIKGVPGVSAVTTGPNVSKPFIRGLGYNRVLTLYDGIRQEGQQWGDEHGIEIDQYGIARAEVVKGPASLSYGSDALAGVINMIPYLPNYENNALKGDYTVDYHTNNGLIGSSLGLAYKHNDWRFTARGTGKLAHNYKNSVDGRVYGTAYNELNLSAMARVDKKWGYTQFAGTLFNNKQEIPDGSRDSLTRRFTRQILDAGDDIKNRPIVPENELKTYKLNPLYQHIQHYRLYSSSQFNVGEGNINVLLGGQQSVRREYNHPTQPSQAGLYVVLNTLNYDVKYNLPQMAGIETSVSVNGMYQTNRSKDATDFPIPDYDLFDIGAFLFAKKSFGPVDVSGGLRLDNRHINWNNFFVADNPQNGFQKRVTGADTVGTYLQFPSFSKRYNGWSGSLGLTYNVSERLLLKANIARGYRAPNITEIGSNGLDPGAHIVYLGNRTFKPEFNIQQDIGVIAYLKDVDLSAELFNNHIYNYIYQARLNDANGQPVVIVPGNSTYQYQQSKASLYGAEVTVNLHPEKLKWFVWNNSLSYVEGLNKNPELLARVGDAAKYLPFIPPLHARSELRVNFQKESKTLAKPYIKLEADAYATQNHFYALDDTETATPGYTLWNAGCGSGFKNKAGKTILDVFLQVDNVFDKAYQSNLNRLKYFEYYQSSPNGRSGIYNIGRNVSLKVIIPL
ncbi:TonB-dependent receptor [Mucilaginibacter terrae]|uniref:Iron complex outermembrane receptor protein n=1 Tax=Mucilaginibacter terrae TaxID=1955052 RepID=A0ABU3GX51_9SPHI|nr:TonB-dependent receptor [Mucilaginibacter terrae]MDT3404339.1 iron complex outermembrane receptor protein [Mucilaginibacter terrae]